MRIGKFARAIFATLFLAGTASAQEAPQRGGTLTFSVTGEPETYDCHASVSVAVFHRVAPHYSTLLRIDPANYPNIVGDLASEWSVSEDKLSYFVKLRVGVKFHDGTTLSAADVKATFERIMNPPQGVLSARRTLFADVQAIETPDPLTIVFRLKQPNVAMPVVLANPWNCIYSAAKLASDPSYPARSVMGTGPFRFREHVAGATWSGTRFENYFREGFPYLDGFTAVSLAGPALVNALAGGRTQVDFRGVAPAERDRLIAERPGRIRFEETPQTGLLMLTFNTSRKPFDDARVRRALSMGLDRWSGAAPLGRLTIFGIPGGFLRPGDALARSREELSKLPGYAADMNAARTEARRLLAEAGHENLSIVITNRPQYTPLGIYLIDQWRQIGVNARQEQPENTAFFGARAGGQFDVIFDAMNDYVDDPSLYFAQFLSVDRARHNISRSTDRELDSLYDQQARSFDPAERRALAQRFEARMLEQATSIPYFWSLRIIPLANEVQGWRLTPSYFLDQDLAQIWLKR
jgi:peptide/nickel transport system substrate-binding protein